MIWFETVILYLMAAILGLWSASLIWRIVHARIKNFRARASGQTAGARAISPGRVRLGMAAACVALPAGVIAAVMGEWVQSGIKAGHFDLWALIPRAAMWLTLLLAGGAIIGGWWFDPAHGRRRCPKCWYDMSAVPGPRCPECGLVARNEKAFGRTRRSPSLLGVAGLLFAGTYGADVAPDVLKHGWFAAMPTTVLIAGLPWVPESWLGGKVWGLQERVVALEVKEWQYGFLQWRARRLLTDPASFDAMLRGRQFYHKDRTLSGVRVELAAEIITVACSNGAHATDARMMLFGEVDWNDSAFCEALKKVDLSVVKEAMASNSTVRQQFAVWLVKKMDGDESLVPLLEQVIQRPEPNPARGEAISVVAWLSDQYPSAWRVLADCLQSPDARIRTSAITEGPRARTHRDEVREFAVRALADPSDDMVYASVLTLSVLEVSPCEIMGDVEPLISSKPRLRRVLLGWLIRSRCEAAAILPHLRSMLASADVRDQEAGIVLAGNLGEGAAPLLPLLREFEKYAGMPDRRKEFADSAIREIESSTTPNQDGGAANPPGQHLIR